MWALLLLIFPALFLVWFGLAKAKQRQSDSRDLVVSNYIKTPKGRAMLAEAMLRPIRKNLDRQKIERRVYAPHVITVAAPETELTVQDLHDTLKEIEDGQIS